MSYECPLLALAHERDLMPVVRASVVVNTDQRHAHMPAKYKRPLYSVFICCSELPGIIPILRCVFLTSWWCRLRLFS